MINPRTKTFISTLLLFTIFCAPFNIVQAQITPADEARLRAELAQVEKEQAETEKVLAATKQESASLTRDISILNTKIKAAQLNIKAKNLIIESLGHDITVKKKTITHLESKITQGKESLAQIMRKTSELDDYSLPDILLSSHTLTETLADLDTFESVQESLKITFEELRGTKTQTEGEKNVLDKRKNQELDARAVISREQKNIQAAESEKKVLLGESKSAEKAYGQVLAEKKAKAAQIRSALFALAGGSKAIPFGDALKFAQEAQRTTGIRPAFLLAIITQESNLGANVGSCYVTSLETGDGVGKNTGSPFEQVMKAPRDTAPFKDITAALGRDWKSTPVSCPIGSAKYYKGRGFGGAMGPSQFIPSTWDLFKDRIASGLGVSQPNPWNPEHAFMASALYLTDLGAINGSYTGEIKAACRYYGSGGASCVYGTQVMTKAANIQRNMIDPLQGV